MQLLSLETTLRTCGQRPDIYSGCTGVTRCSQGAFLPGISMGGPQLAFDAFLPTWLSGPKHAAHRPIPLPYMYSETGALEMVWAGGCRLVWLPRPLL